MNTHSDTDPRSGLTRKNGGAGLAPRIFVMAMFAFGFSPLTLAKENSDAGDVSQPDPPNFWLSSYSQGLGIMSPAQWDIEANLYGMSSHFSGLGAPPANGGGLQSGQFAVRRQIPSVPGLDVGFVTGGSYLSQGTISGDVPSKGISGFATAHYAAKIYRAFGAGAYGQVGGAAQQTGNEQWSATRVASITPVLAWEPEEGIINSVALNPMSASFTATGQLSQGPSLKDLVGLGLNLGIGFNSTNRSVLTPEFSYVRSTGSPLANGGQSAWSDTYRIGLVDTISYAAHGSAGQTNSISLGIWYYQENGEISGAPPGAAAAGTFVTRGGIFGVTFGCRRPVLGLF